MSTPTLPARATTTPDDARLAVQRHDLDPDGMDAYFAAYAEEHPEWCGTAVER